MLLTASCSASESPPQAATSNYQLNYRVTPEPAQNRVQVQLTLVQSRSLLRQMRMQAPAKYFSQFSGDGQISVRDDQVEWRPPKRGGTLSWSVALNRLKSGDSYKAYITHDWALFRGSDIIPPATTRTLKGAASRTSLAFSLPVGWSAVTQYYGRQHKFRVRNPERRFDRPTGWILLGEMGVRTEIIAGIKVKIAAPKNHGTRRLDMLALLAWTLPEITRLFTDPPSRLTIISAGNPMWRGGLSAPASLFIHASLPLLSENGTSVLLHEIVHSGMRASAGPGADWIIEGLAEYYSLQVLLRSGTISQHRFDQALGDLAAWGEDAESLCSNNASGAITAKATLLMYRLDTELETKTGGKYNLDDVMNALIQKQQKITLEDLKTTVTRFLAAESDIISRAELSSCPT